MHTGGRETPAWMNRPPDIRLQLSPTGDAAAQARFGVAGSEHLAQGVAATLGLLVTELVTNSMRHAGLSRRDRIEVRAWVYREPLRVEVVDSGPGFDPN